MAEVNYKATPVKGTTVNATRSVYDETTRKYEKRERSFIILGANDDGSLNLERLNETFEYNNKTYSVSYVGPNRR